MEGLFSERLKLLNGIYLLDLFSDINVWVRFVDKKVSEVRIQPIVYNLTTWQYDPNFNSGQSSFEFYDKLRHCTQVQGVS